MSTKTTANEISRGTESAPKHAWRRCAIAASLALLWTLPAAAQSELSVARQWDEELLEAIRNDLARPTVHARNLFHVSVAMWDAWAAVSRDF